MTTEISPLQKVQDNIRDRIKAEFVNLIPDEMWTAMVDSVVTDFTNDTRLDSYGRKVEGGISPLKKLIKDQIEALAKDAIAKELASLDQGYWTSFGRKVTGDALKNLIAANFADILAAVQGGIVEQTVMTTVNHMRNSMTR